MLTPQPLGWSHSACGDGGLSVMKSKLLGAVFAAAMVAVCQFHTASAATINTNGTGEVTSITGLDVGGSFFDVTFFSVGTSYETAYGGADVEYSNALAIASAIAQLLNAQATIPDIAGTLGNTAQSGFIVPLSVVGTDLSVYYASRTPPPFPAYNDPPTFAPITRTTGINPEFAWTEVSLTAATATPLPAALPLFATGLGAFGLIGWRRKRKGRFEV